MAPSAAAQRPPPSPPSSQSPQPHPGQPGRSSPSAQSAGGSAAQSAAPMRLLDGADSETRWARSGAHVAGLRACVDGVRELLEKAAFVDDETFALVSVQQQYTTTVLAQERRIAKLTETVASARAAERAAEAARVAAEGSARAAEAERAQLRGDLANQDVLARAHTEELVRLAERNERLEQEVEQLRAQLAAAGITAVVVSQ